MSEISLTASMRSNLLSLQQIAKLQDATQLRLSTGLKVNSAIDNPSSYYTASSLNNRAEDLSALLDSMGQSVQTIKAATEGIEKAEDLLSQMKAIAEQVNTGVYVPEKSYFEKKVGTNGAVVTNAEELRAAVDSGKEEICIYGKIDLGDISTAGGISLQENQKLVGVNYYGNFGTEGEEFSGISGSATVEKNLIDIKKTGCLVSDLSLNYENMSRGAPSIVDVRGAQVSADFNNLNLKGIFETSTFNRRAAIKTANEINLLGKINIQVSGKLACGIIATGNSAIANINSDSILNINTDGTQGHGIWGVSGGAKINIAEGSNIEINIAKNAGRGIYVQEGAVADIWGNIQILNLQGNGFETTISGNNKINIYNSAQIYINTGSNPAFANRNTNGNSNILNIASGAKIAIEKDGNTKWYEVKEDYHDENTSTMITNIITADNFEIALNVATTEAWKTAGDVEKEQEQEKAAQAEKEAEEQANREVYQKQYNNALSQYDSLIKDSSYKGVNLLQADDLKVIFNENRSSTLEVSGVDLSSDKIGMMTADWSKAKDVQTSLDQIINAKNTLRSASTKLGNYYSIITERETFTDNLINVLEEGADKLTLADMNEESANMLSLQTQQQLAINSLSLASQASQAVLRLF